NHTKPDEAYSWINRAWVRDPKSFFPYLEAIGFQEPSKLIGSSFRQMYSLAEMITDTENAPQWGWENFLMNAPRP
ncbi:MAG: hypothetical protein AB7H97_21930, partial [Pseudobdellovibrionaceae bacterium]